MGVGWGWDSSQKDVGINKFLYFCLICFVCVVITTVVAVAFMLRIYSGHCSQWLVREQEVARKIVRSLLQRRLSKGDCREKNSGRIQDLPSR